MAKAVDAKTIKKLLPKDTGKWGYDAQGSLSMCNTVVAYSVKCLIDAYIDWLNECPAPLYSEFYKVFGKIVQRNIAFPKPSSLK